MKILFALATLSIVHGQEDLPTNSTMRRSKFPGKKYLLRLLNQCVEESNAQGNEMQSMFCGALYEKVYEDGVTPSAESWINSNLNWNWDDEAMDRVMDANCLGAACPINFNLKGIWQYGCWCNFGAHLMKGRGPAVNEYDQFCKNFQLCLRCARFDGKQDGYACDPIGQEYILSTKVGKFVHKCKAGNMPDLCAVHTCTCEQQLLADIIESIWNGVAATYDSTPLHSNGFSQKKHCPASLIGNGDEIDCCGKYPARYPYSLGGSKACCDDTEIYSMMDEECCGGEVFPTGGCV